MVFVRSADEESIITCRKVKGKTSSSFLPLVFPSTYDDFFYAYGSQGYQGNSFRAQSHKNRFLVSFYGSELKDVLLHFGVVPLTFSSRPIKFVMLAAVKIVTERHSALQLGGMHLQRTAFVRSRIVERISRRQKVQFSLSRGSSHRCVRFLRGNYSGSKAPENVQQQRSLEIIITIAEAKLPVATAAAKSNFHVSLISLSL